MDYIIGAIIILAIGIAILYIVKAKKNGAKCIGCPSCKSCTGHCGQSTDK